MKDDLNMFVLTSGSGYFLAGNQGCAAVVEVSLAYG